MPMRGARQISGSRVLQTDAMFMHPAQMGEPTSNKLTAGSILARDHNN